MAQDIDHVMKTIGGLNKFQYLLILLLGINMFTSSNHSLISTFTSGEPPWRCRGNSSNCQLSGEINPRDSQYKLRCSLKEDDWEFVDTYTSIVTQWNLVCDKSILASLSTSMYFAGFLAGVVCFGLLSDTYGRRKPVVAALIFVSLVGTISAYSQSLIFYSACRFIIGFTGGGSGLIIFILASEFSDVQSRGAVGTSLWYFFCLSNMLLAPMAYSLSDWRDLTMATSLPGFVVLLTLWWIPESPRWLLVQGKQKEAEDILRQVARINGTIYPEEPLKVPQVRDANGKVGNVLDMFRPFKVARQTLIQWASWFVNGMVYYGVSMTGDSIGGNMYWNFFLVTMIEIPGTFAVIILMTRYGRKYVVVGGLVAAALAAMLTAAIPYSKNPGNTAGRIIGSLMAKFAIVISFDAIYVFSAELIPTSIRNSGMATCSASARLGSFAAPYILWMQRIHVVVPYGIMSATSLIAGVLCLTLPETKGQPTPEVVSSNGESSQGYQELKNIDSQTDVTNDVK